MKVKKLFVFLLLSLIICIDSFAKNSSGGGGGSGPVLKGYSKSYVDSQNTGLYEDTPYTTIYLKFSLREKIFWP